MQLNRHEIHIDDVGEALGAIFIHDGLRAVVFRLDECEQSAPTVTIDGQIFASKDSVYAHYFGRQGQITIKEDQLRRPEGILEQTKVLVAAYLGRLFPH